MTKQVATIDLDRAALGAGAVDRRFLEARTHNRWLDAPVDPKVLRRLYDMAKMAPTSANSQPTKRAASNKLGG